MIWNIKFWLVKQRGHKTTTLNCAFWESNCHSSIIQSQNIRWLLIIPSNWPWSPSKDDQVRLCFLSGALWLILFTNWLLCTAFFLFLYSKQRIAITLKYSVFYSESSSQYLLYYDQALNPLASCSLPIPHLSENNSIFQHYNMLHYNMLHYYTDVDQKYNLVQCI